MKLINVFPCLEKKVKIALKEMNMAQFTDNCASSIEIHQIKIRFVHVKC